MKRIEASHLGGDPLAALLGGCAGASVGDDGVRDAGPASLGQLPVIGGVAELGGGEEQAHRLSVTVRSAVDACCQAICRAEPAEETAPEDYVDLSEARASQAKLILT